MISSVVKDVFSKGFASVREGDTLSSYARYMRTAGFQFKQ